jgi:hypothetical protein
MFIAMLESLFQPPRAGGSVMKAIFWMPAR